MKQLILGSPGTGKTTELLRRVEVELAKGTPPDKIAFVSYTKKAADEAAARAMERFDLERSQLPYFRTIHSLCFRALHLSRDDVIDRNDLREIGRSLGIRFSGRGRIEDGPGGGGVDGDQYLSLISYAKAIRKPLEQTWNDVAPDMDWWRLSQVNDTLEKYKADAGKLDFDDMLFRYIRDGVGALPVDVAIIDEAQDNTANQWAVVRSAFSGCRAVLYAGDDDQAIYQWAGADVKAFLSLDAPGEVLGTSHRLPKAIWEYANSLALRIGERYKKDWAPANHSGSINMMPYFKDIDFSGAGSWMVLARNHFVLQEVISYFRSIGIAYRTVGGNSVRKDHLKAIILWERFRRGKELSQEDMELSFRFTDHGEDGKDRSNQYWHDALTGISVVTREYYRSILRAGGRLQDAPVIYVGTIHSVKGGEADNVVLLSDVSSKTRASFEKNPDAEHRVFYVGATRAKKNLFLVSPKTEWNYSLCS